MAIYVFALFLYFHPTVHIVLILASWFVGGVFDLIGFLRSTSDFCPPVNVHSTLVLVQDILKQGITFPLWVASI